MGENEKQTWVIGTANWDSLAKLVLDVDIASTLLAKSLRVAVGLVELSALAKQATVRLATKGLDFWPLRLGIAWWASIRAESTLLTVWLGSTSNVSLLDTGPLVVTDPFDWDGSVLFWEVVTVDLSIWEWSIDAGGSRWLLDWLLGWLGLLGGGSGGWLGGRGRRLTLLLLDWRWGSESSSLKVVGGGGPWDTVLVDNDGVVDNFSAD